MENKRSPIFDLNLSRVAERMTACTAALASSGGDISSISPGLETEAIIFPELLVIAADRIK